MLPLTIEPGTLAAAGARWWIIKWMLAGKRERFCFAS
jgi:hypothetical protein